MTSDGKHSHLPGFRGAERQIVTGNAAADICPAGVAFAVDFQRLDIPFKLVDFLLGTVAGTLQVVDLAVEVDALISHGKDRQNNHQ